MSWSERKIALQLAYDGTDFVGSQWQPTGRSVQGVLEAGWASFAQEERRLIFAGRTDAGVHAQGQVVHVETATRHTPATAQRALNALLPADVAVLGAWEVADGFHARFSAAWRRYRYLIDTNRVQLPLVRRYALHVAQSLDVAAMQAALALLPGEHDFAAFASTRPDEGPTVRRCMHAGCATVTWAGWPLLAVDLVANGFLRHMVRTIIGTLLLVGWHRLSLAEFAQVLASRDRRRAGPTAAAHGLLLVAVGYPPEAVPEDMYRLLQGETS